MSITEYWPDFNIPNVSQCVKTEAETTDESVFLAVHKPMSFERVEIQSGLSEYKKELDLLHHFLLDHPSGTLLMPIIGNSGAGKSHAVKWLEAQLKRHARRNEFHIIRIPKNTSLKEVLNRILKNLTGKKYDKLRTVLGGAQEAISQGQLHIQLESAIRSELESIVDNNGYYQSQKLSDLECTLAHKDLLGAYISDHSVKKILVENGCFDRILKHFNQSNIEEDIKFCDSDFNDIDNKDDDELNHYARDFHSFYMSDQEIKSTVIALLNTVLDGALNGLLDLRSNNLSELFIDVRKYLKEDGKELILLVEDFTRLAGIQKNLLDVMVREAFRPGEGEDDLCVMRTALAVTSGFIKGFDTVATRAVYEWEIKVNFRQSDKNLFIDNVCDLAGRYLNAARLGYDFIASKFEESFSEVEIEKLDNWIPEFKSKLEEEEVKRLDAFGRSPESNYYLFPYNRNAISVMADKHLIEGQNFDYNPRKIINLLLLTPLSNTRKSFYDGSFLSSFDDFHVNNMAYSIQDNVSKLVGVNNPRLNDYYSLFHYWGGNKTIFDDVKISQPIFESFSLKPYCKLRKNTESEDDIEIEKDKDTQLRESSKDGKDTDFFQKEIMRWEQDLLRPWFDGEMLGQVNANVIRKKILDDAFKLVRWDCEFNIITPKRKDIPSWNIYIPKARGQNNKDVDECIFVALSDSDLNNPKKSLDLKRTLMAVVKNYIYNDWRPKIEPKGWDYNGAEEEYPVYLSLIKKAASALLIHYRNLFKVEKERRLQDQQKLMLYTKILAIEGAQSPKTNLFVNSLFANQDISNRTYQNQNWEKMISYLTTERTELIENLKNTFCIYQGAGTSEHALIPFEIHCSFKNIKSIDWEIDIPRVFSQIEIRKKFLLNDILLPITKALGNDFDPHELRNVILDTMTELNKGYANYDNFDALRDKIRGLKNINLKEIVKNLQKLSDKTLKKGNTIDLIVKRDDKDYLFLKQTINDLQNMLYACESNLGEQEIEDKNGVVKFAINNIVDALEDVHTLFNLEEAK